MKTATTLLALSTIAFLLTGCQSTETKPNTPLAKGAFDGRYGANFAFEMGPATVCPSALPITIELSVEGEDISGVILNDGGENTHEFCALYHNGTIMGKISETGEFVGVKVSQKDSHSREYSSYKITGNLNGELTLVSRQRQFHPNSLFSISKR